MHSYSYVENHPNTQALQNEQKLNRNMDELQDDFNCVLLKTSVYKITDFVSVCKIKCYNLMLY